MDVRAFLGLGPGDEHGRWSLPVERRLCTFGGFLFGGCGLGAAIAALEDACRRPLIWATGQYLSYARPGDRLDVDVTVAVAGHQVSQARAVCRVGDREILTVNAALGDRPGMPSGQFETMPTVRPPSAYAPRPRHTAHAGWVDDQLDDRLVKGRPVDERDGTLADGQAMLWMRIPSVINTALDGMDAATLAVLGDFVPLGVGSALGIRGGGRSLDNTLRVGKLVPTEWVLLDIRVHSVERGFGHGLVHMFAEDGTLLATASQSCIVRHWPDPDDDLDDGPDDDPDDDLAAATAASRQEAP